jgi:hypothetical protein
MMVLVSDALGTLFMLAGSPFTCNLCTMDTLATLDTSRTLFMLDCTSFTCGACTVDTFPMFDTSEKCL